QRGAVAHAPPGRRAHGRTAGPRRTRSLRRPPPRGWPLLIDCNRKETTMPTNLNVTRRVFMGGAAAAAGLAFQDLAHAQTASGSLTVGVPADLLSLDPANANDTLSQSTARLMLEGLLGFDRNMKVIPQLAESYTANDNATEFTFHLRQGI